MMRLIVLLMFVPACVASKPPAMKAVSPYRGRAVNLRVARFAEDCMLGPNERFTWQGYWNFNPADYVSCVSAVDVLLDADRDGDFDLYDAASWMVEGRGE